MTSRVAAVDCGTNTIKLLIAEAGPDGTLTELVRELRMVRLGQGVDATGMLAPEALERTFAAVEEYATLVAHHGVEPSRIRFVATSATRDAGNAEEFATGVFRRLGVRPEVVSGEEEATLAFTGAVRALRSAPGSPARPPVMVLDIGGGSTELIMGHENHVAVPAASVSLDIGSVRLTERFLASDPPTATEIAACRDHIDQVLANPQQTASVDPASAGTLVGVAGTVTQMAAGVLGLTSYLREVIDQAVLEADEVRALTDRLLLLSVEERRALTWMHPQRADVILAGALILCRVLDRTGTREMVVSESDILDGIAWSLTDRFLTD